MPPEKIYKSQKELIQLYLIKMGYPRYLLHSIIYALQAVIYLGMHHLGYEQGIQQVLQFLRHFRAQTFNGTLHAITIDAYQPYLLRTG